MLPLDPTIYIFLLMIANVGQALYTWWKQKKEKSSFLNNARAKHCKNLIIKLHLAAGYYYSAQLPHRGINGDTI